MGALGLAHGIAFSASYQLVRGPLACRAPTLQWHVQQPACTCYRKIIRCGQSAAVDRGQSSCPCDREVGEKTAKSTQLADTEMKQCSELVELPYDSSYPRDSLVAIADPCSLRHQEAV